MSTKAKSKLGYFLVAFCSFYLGMEFATEGAYAFLSHVISVIVVIYLIGAFVQWRQKRKAKKQARRARAAKLLADVVSALSAPPASPGFSLDRERYSRLSRARQDSSGMGRTLAAVAEATGTPATAPEAQRPSPSSDDGFCPDCSAPWDADVYCSNEGHNTNTTNPGL